MRIEHSNAERHFSNGRDKMKQKYVRFVLIVNGDRDFPEDYRC